MGAPAAWVEDRVEDVTNSVGDVVKDVGNVLADIDDKIIQPAVKIVSTTIDNALKDPIGTIAKIATAVYAPYLLPYVNAASVLANGGSMEDAFKAGALTWVGQEAFANLQLGTETLPDGFVGPPEVITAKSLSSDLGNWVSENASAVGNIGKDILSNAAVQGSLGAVKGGLMAAIQGKNIGEGISQGFTSGSLSGGVSAGFADATKALGLDKISKQDAMAGKTILALASGEDPNAILANYLAYTVNSKGADLIAKTSKDAYDAFNSYSRSFSEKNTDYENDVTAYQSARQKYVEQNDGLQKDILEKWNPIQARLDGILAEQTNLKEDFDKQKAIYDDTSKSVEDRNAAANKMADIAEDYNKKDTEYTKLYDENKGIYTDLESRRDSILSNIENLDNTVGKDLQTTRTELENDVKTLADYKTQYENASETHDTAIAEATTKNFLIDAINNGVITGEQQEDGSIVLSNGMTIEDGQFLQDGKNAFANADPIEQGEIRFTNQDGKETWYSNDRSRQVSTTDAQDMLLDQYGIKADRADVLGIAGQKFDEVNEDSIKSVASNKVNDEYNSLLGRDATQEEIDAAFAPGEDALRNVAGKLSAEIVPTDQFFSSEDDKVAYAKQLAAVREDKGVGAEFTWYNPFTNDWETHQAFTNADVENEETIGGVKVDDNVFTSQWQTVGDKRVFIHDDGSASVIDRTTGETDSLDQNQVGEWIEQGLLNSFSSGYYDAIGRTGLSEEEFIAQQGDDEDGPTYQDYINASLRYKDGLTLEEFIAQEDGGGGPTFEDYERAALRYTGDFDTLPRKAPIPGPGSPDRPTDPRGYMLTGVLPGTPGAGQPGVQPGAQKGVLPTGNPLEQDYLNIGLSKDKFIDPLAQLYQIQQATAQGGDGNLAQLMFQQFNPTAPQATEPTEASGKGDSYYNYGEMDDTYTGAIDPFTPSPYTPSPYAQGFEAAKGGAIMANPLMAQGGKTLPLNVNGVLPTVSQGRENFKDGKHVAGEGDGQSDDIPAWLADGEFVFPADVVSALGNGSTKAGTDKLYDMMHSIREKARSTNPKDLPPPAKKSPLDYLRA
jgi:hypothetical protein